MAPDDLPLPHRPPPLPLQAPSPTLLCRSAASRADPLVPILSHPLELDSDEDDTNEVLVVDSPPLLAQSGTTQAPPPPEMLPKFLRHQTCIKSNSHLASSSSLVPSLDPHRQFFFDSPPPPPEGKPPYLDEVEFVLAMPDPFDSSGLSGASRAKPQQQSARKRVTFEIPAPQQQQDPKAASDRVLPASPPSYADVVHRPQAVSNTRDQARHLKLKSVIVAPNPLSHGIPSSSKKATSHLKWPEVKSPC